MRAGPILSPLLVLLLSALVAWQGNNLLLNGPAAVLPSEPSKACEISPHFSPAFPADAALVQSALTNHASTFAYTFMGNSWLSADTCTGGTLRMVGEGTVAGGTAPRLEVALNSRIIWTGEFSDRQEVKVPVSAGGHLTLGYFNDYYSSDYRNAVLERVRFQSAGCEKFEVSVSPMAGGSWDPKARRVTWLFAGPITLTPCTPGILHLRVSGREGGGAFSRLIFKQGEQIIREVVLSDRPQELTIELTAAPLEIRISNPYFKELGDRNLTLREIAFTPDQ